MACAMTHDWINLMWMAEERKRNYMIWWIVATSHCVKFNSIYLNWMNLRMAAATMNQMAAGRHCLNGIDWLMQLIQSVEWKTMGYGVAILINCINWISFVSSQSVVWFSQWMSVMKLMKLM